MYSQHVSAADYSHGTPFGEEDTEFSDSGCVGVDYGVRNNELLKDPDVSPVFMTNAIPSQARRCELSITQA